MTVTVASFRQALAPVFDNTTTYPDGAVQFQIDGAYASMPASFWGAQLDYAVTLYVAHMLILNARTAAASGGGSGIPGIPTGAAQSKTVDKVSVSYDTKFGIDEAAGWWNQTSYGQMLWQLLVRKGAGPRYFIPIPSRNPLDAKGF